MLCWFCHTTTSISHNYISMGFSCGSPGEESTCAAGDPHSVSGSERSPGEGHGYPVALPGEFHGQRHTAVCGSQRVERGWVTKSSLLSLLPIPPRRVTPESQAGLPMSQQLPCQLSIYTRSVPVSTTFSIRPNPPFLHCGPKSMPDISVPIPSLQIGSLVLFS